METMLNWIGVGSAGLLAVAVTVAWWEQRKRLAHKRRALAAAQPALLGGESVPAPDAAHDLPQRRQALDSAMQRMSRAGTSPAPAAGATLSSPAAAAPTSASADPAASHPGAWADTVPMVQASGIPIRRLPDLHWDGGKGDEPSRPMDLHLS